VRPQKYEEEKGARRLGTPPRAHVKEREHEGRAGKQGKEITAAGVKFEGNKEEAGRGQGGEEQEDAAARVV
jgi:hypothetical protein